MKGVYEKSKLVGEGGLGCVRRNLRVAMKLEKRAIRLGCWGRREEGQRLGMRLVKAVALPS